MSATNDTQERLSAARRLLDNPRINHRKTAEAIIQLVEASEARCATLDEVLKETLDNLGRAWVAHGASEARCAALTKALERYGSHRVDCARSNADFAAALSGIDCTCGLAEVLAAAPTREPDPLEGLPPDLVRILRDPSILVPQDAAVFELIVKAVEDLRCPFVSAANVRCYLDRGHKGGHRPYPPEWGPAPAREKFCPKCRHAWDAHGPDGCDVEIRDYGHMDCDCREAAPTREEDFNPLLPQPRLPAGVVTLTEEQAADVARVVRLAQNPWRKRTLSGASWEAARDRAVALLRGEQPQ